MPHQDDPEEEQREYLGLPGPTEEDPEDAAKRKQRLSERQQLFTYLMGIDLFREWLMEELVKLGTFTNPFSSTPGGFPDRMATEFALGMKAAGWHIWETFDDLVPEQTALMRREFNDVLRAKVLAKR